jgi:hypothetical protein
VAQAQEQFGNAEQAECRPLEAGIRGVVQRHQTEKTVACCSELVKV